ncbi:hypothetical protein D3874_09160 [Oleomonas cavernae]|uniref:Uncharacterized protein n=1 Tax=Oleomonas cavernae TaxID=2320859 RepID=A0A418WB31_9PROT|nr:hypothetical protein [Oleomonas cavernae]RJF87174.1 hypothetical protein D3874_09160 [Oleomonas cavernae]
MPYLFGSQMMWEFNLSDVVAMRTGALSGIFVGGVLLLAGCAADPGGPAGAVGGTSDPRVALGEECARAVSGPDKAALSMVEQGLIVGPDPVPDILSDPQRRARLDLPVVKAAARCLAVKNYTAYSRLAFSYKDEAEFWGLLDLAMIRIRNGDSMLVSMLQMKNYWLASQGRVLGKPPLRNLSETAALLASYMYVVALADGAKCPNRQIAATRIPVLLVEAKPVFASLAGRSADELRRLSDMVLALEARTLSWRRDDAVLCNASPEALASMRFYETSTPGDAQRWDQSIRALTGPGGWPPQSDEQSLAAFREGVRRNLPSVLRDVSGKAAATP